MFSCSFTKNKTPNLIKVTKKKKPEKKYTVPQLQEANEPPS